MAQRESIFEGALPHIFLLVTAATLVICGAVFAKPFLLYGAWALFLLWDACFVCTDQLSDRTADSVFEYIGQARTNPSWYIIVFGGAIAYLATSEGAEKFFVTLANKSQLGAGLAIVPMTAASLAVLFIPIKKTPGPLNPPPLGAANPPCAPALKSLFGVCIFLQKVAITSFVYSAIRLVAHIVETTPP
jgi:hypothetical protein